jgi:hypothetical protein
VRLALIFDFESEHDYCKNFPKEAEVFCPVHLFSNQRSAGSYVCPLESSACVFDERYGVIDRDSVSNAPLSYSNHRSPATQRLNITK